MIIFLKLNKIINIFLFLKIYVTTQLQLTILYAVSLVTFPLFLIENDSQNKKKAAILLLFGVDKNKTILALFCCIFLCQMLYFCIKLRSKRRKEKQKKHRRLKY